MFTRFKERREAKGRERLHDKYERVFSSWNEDDEFMTTCIKTAQSFAGDGDPCAADAPATVHPGERVVGVVQGVGLVEPKRLPGHWQGGYSGFSFRIAKGVRHNVGGTRGHFEQGAEVISPVDVGNVLVTDKRVVFTGERKAREWQFAKLLGLHHDPDAPRTFLPVSNREAVSGIAYPGSGAPDLRFRISLAIALFNGRLDEFIDELTREHEAHQSERPTEPVALVDKPVATAPAGSERPANEQSAGAPAVTATTRAGAGWYADPSGKHAWRYYDGATWTSTVSDGGSVSSDT
jgi:hypothetical protein